jgi:acetylxylan esterase
MVEPQITLMTAKFRSCVLATTVISVGLLSGMRAEAGTYGKINQSDWTQGSTGLPTYVNMYSFVPSTVATKPPIVVYLHHCQGNAASSHSSMSGLESLADKNGFLIIYPEATGENCWDAGSKRSLKNGGGGDTGAIVQMVKYYLAKYSGDANRVYVAGDSSGGIMTEAIIGVYPDVFMAGVSIMGVPCGCWGQSDYNDVTGSGGTAQWCNSCAGGTVSKTGQQWGDLVRSYFPGYTGHRPRLQHWHGASDTTLNYKNVAEDIKEWTNLLALSETPTGTEQNTPKSGTTHQLWKNSCYTVYETFILANTGHMVSVDGATLAKYFGIDTAGGQDPETAACGAGAVPGGGGGTTPGGTGGASGTGGSLGSGGAGGGRDGGPGARDGSSDVSAAGGSQGSGGSQQGGAPGTGGASTSGTGGKVGASGGASGSVTGGSLGAGGVVANGGSVSAGGSSAGGSAGHSSGSGGAVAAGGSLGTGGSAGAAGKSDGGCAFAADGRGSPKAAFLMALFFATFVLRSRRRGR